MKTSSSTFYTTTEKRLGEQGRREEGKMGCLMTGLKLII
jgi:hypothetical protein